MGSLVPNLGNQQRLRFAFVLSGYFIAQPSNTKLVLDLVKNPKYPVLAAEASKLQELVQILRPLSQVAQRESAGVTGRPSNSNCIRIFLLHRSEPFSFCWHVGRIRMFVGRISISLISVSKYHTTAYPFRGLARIDLRPPTFFKEGNGGGALNPQTWKDAETVIALAVDTVVITSSAFHARVELPRTENPTARNVAVDACLQLIKERFSEPSPAITLS